MNLRTALIKNIKTLANPERAVQQQAYMKSTMAYAGLTAGELRSMAKAVFAEHPIEDAATWQALVLEIWEQAQVREERYAAIELLGLPRYTRQWRDRKLLRLIKKLVVSGAWWDYVDNLAANHVGPILATQPDQVTPTMMEWSRQKHLWVRRTAILSQLKFKDRIDLDLLTYAIEGSIEDDDFFARKAIGWALRQTARTHPGWVQDYVAANEARLSGLSKREALKHIG